VNGNLGEMRVPAVSALLTLLCLSSADAASLFSDFGAGDTFQLGISNSLAVGSGAHFGNDGYEIAVGIIDVIPVSHQLDRIRFAALHVEGPNSLLLRFLAGTDLDTAVTLESFPFEDVVAEDTGSIYTAVSSLKPSLSFGEIYWLALSATDPINSAFGWNYNDLGYVGYAFRTTGGSWTGFQGTSTAFEVDVVSAAVPEPGLGLLSGALVAGLALRMSKQIKKR
jgi:hypothetical protein